jgi:hypothetical protein
MDGISNIGKTIILVGVAIVVFGIVVLVLSRLTGGRGAPLPGDIYIRRPGMVIYFPIITSIVISVILTVLLWIVLALRR